MPIADSPRPGARRGRGPGRSRPAGAALAAACALLILAAPPAPARGGAAGGLTGLAGLKAAYDALLDARFDRTRQRLARACGPAPPPACEVVRAAAMWWQILLDPHDTSRDEAFLRQAEHAIESAERWVEREPGRAEAWFYLGGAYGARVSWRVQRGERLAAARDGKRIKEALEQALEIEPTLDDARFGIGLYKYYADVAPAAARLLRFLLLLPGGDRQQGLRDMQATEARGHLIAGEALYQLHWIYLWYEQQPARGLEALEQLHARYPGNPHFLQRIGEVQSEYFHDPARSLAAWRRLADTAGSSGEPAIARVRGRLGMAEQLDALGETDRAIEQLERVLAEPPSRPAGARARARLLLGRALDRIGERAAALESYRLALSAPVPDEDPEEIHDAARAGLARAPAPQAADAYRLALEGWRALERGDLPTADARLAEARGLSPDDPLVRARLALLGARAEPDRALDELDRIIAARPDVPPVALNAAYLWSARLLASDGRRDEAADRYRAATRVHGGDSRMADQARAALARLERR